MRYITWSWDPRLPFFAESGRREAVLSIYKFRIDLTDMPERFQPLPGVESGFQDRLMNRFEVLIAWSDKSL